MSIHRILARQIFDSRGNPTVEVDLRTSKGILENLKLTLIYYSILRFIPSCSSKWCIYRRS